MWCEECAEAGRGQFGTSTVVRSPRVIYINCSELGKARLIHHPHFPASSQASQDASKEMHSPATSPCSSAHLVMYLGGEICFCFVRSCNAIACFSILIRFQLLKTGVSTTWELLRSPGIYSAPLEERTFDHAMRENGLWRQQWSMAGVPSSLSQIP